MVVRKLQLLKKEYLENFFTDSKTISCLKICFPNAQFTKKLGKLSPARIYLLTTETLEQVVKFAES